MLRKLTPASLTKLPQVVADPRAAIDQAIAGSPLARAWIFWSSLIELENWWPLLIPLLIWVFWRTYRRERAAVRLERDRS